VDSEGGVDVEHLLGRDGADPLPMVIDRHRPDLFRLGLGISRVTDITHSEGYLERKEAMLAPLRLTTSTVTDTGFATFHTSTSYSKPHNGNVASSVAC